MCPNPVCVKFKNPCRAKIILGHKTYLRFLSFLYTKLAQVLQILPRGSQAIIVIGKQYDLSCLANNNGDLTIQISRTSAATILT